MYQVRKCVVEAVRPPCNLHYSKGNFLVDPPIFYGLPRVLSTTKTAMSLSLPQNLQLESDIAQTSPSNTACSEVDTATDSQTRSSSEFVTSDGQFCYIDCRKYAASLDPTFVPGEVPDPFKGCKPEDNVDIHSLSEQQLEEALAKFIATL